MESEPRCSEAYSVFMQMINNDSNDASMQLISIDRLSSCCV